MAIKRSAKIKHVKVNTRLCNKTKHRLLMLNYGLVGSCSIPVHKNTQFWSCFQLRVSGLPQMHCSPQLAHLPKRL